MTLASAATAGELLTLDLDDWDTYAELYLPDGLDREVPQPVVVYLHGSGAEPWMYRELIAPAADEAGTVVLMLKSQRREGWGDPDDRPALTAALTVAATHVELDPARRAVAGHSSGGAWALLLALGERGWCAAFAMSSPFVELPEPSDPFHTPPVRLYYGREDPNWQFGAAIELLALLEDLGVPVELDHRLDGGHNSWPPDVMTSGLAFLTDHPRPIPAAETSAVR